MSRRRVAIVGAGIVGLAHALAAVRRGDEVTVFERDAQAQGASVRNFGLGLLLGQPQGEMWDLAWRSRELWLGLLPQLGVWHKAQGSLTVARDLAQWRVLEAFQALQGGHYQTTLLNGEQVAARQLHGLGALHSPHEIGLESRVVLPALAKWLAEAQGVRFVFDTLVREISLPHVRTSRGTFEADEVIVCAGHDFQTLYPEAFAPLGVRRCALQMLRAVAPGLSMAPAVLTGLSTLHYPSFTQEPRLAAVLSDLQAHVRQTQPLVMAHGIHLIIQQVGEGGELIIGDSHQYGTSPSAFEQEAVSAFLMQEAEAVLWRKLVVRERWQGIYASGPRPYEALQVAEGVRCVTITAGVGMSIALGLAERLMATT